MTCKTIPECELMATIWNKYRFTNNKRQFEEKRVSLILQIVSMSNAMR